jgi:hypothetical protein
MAKNQLVRDPEVVNMDDDERISKQLMRVASDINESTPAPMPPRERMEFVMVGKRSSEVLVQAAETLVNQAQSLLEEIKQQAQERLKKDEEIEEQLSALSENIKGFGGDALDLHRKYINPKK